MKIDINEQQAKNILVFLERAQLSGKEVPAYVELLNVINEQLNNPDTTEV